jgi:fumarate reductase flavoprotein subunit
MEQTRRDFLKLGGAAAIVATTAGLAGCGTKASAKSADGKVLGVTALNFAEETDVVIIGTGISGMSAGILPVKAGKKVTFIEKLPTYGGESILSHLISCLHCSNHILLQLFHLHNNTSIFHKNNLNKLILSSS